MSCQSVQDPIVVTPKNIPSKQLIIDTNTPVRVENTTLAQAKPIPTSYTQWLSQKNHAQQAKAYESFLEKHHLANLIPSFELLRTARDWQKCFGQEYAVPSQELWQNQIATLNVFKQLIEQHVLSDFEVTSVYRDLPTNQCVGGASESRHLYNSAIDFRIGPSNPQAADLERIALAKAQLCKFWQQYGAGLNMGLGVYASGQIHIDTQGYRTWGANLNRNTSACTF
ncbi:YcbK family protein [Acinetobacter boissieri]|nr:D-Ala-D-Ala carboxypeptidase family metallohydrolase [Acinetobacter boissieri]